MTDFLVRNLDPDMLEALHARAAANGRSMQAEVHAILRETLEPRPSKEEWWERMRQHREETKGRDIPDVVQMLREDRESH